MNTSGENAVEKLEAAVNVVEAFFERTKASPTKLATEKLLETFLLTPRYILEEYSEFIAGDWLDDDDLEADFSELDCNSSNFGDEIDDALLFHSSPFCDTPLSNEFHLSFDIIADKLLEALSEVREEYWLISEGRKAENCDQVL